MCVRAVSVHPFDDRRLGSHHTYAIYFRGLSRGVSLYFFASRRSALQQPFLKAVMSVRVCFFILILSIAFIKVLCHPGKLSQISIIDTRVAMEIFTCASVFSATVSCGDVIFSTVQVVSSSNQIRTIRSTPQICLVFPSFFDMRHWLSRSFYSILFYFISSS